MKLHAGTYFGIPLYLHWTLLLLFPFIFFTSGYFGVVFATMSLFFVVLHEWGHCLMAKYLKLEVKDVTVYAIGGLARMQIRQNQPIEELLVALAGPFVNFVFAVIFIIICFLHDPVEFIDFSDQLKNHPIYLVSIFGFTANFIMLLFNMLPIFPMDGGRVVRATLTWFTKNEYGSTIVAVRFSQILCVGLIFLSLYLEIFWFAFIFLLMILVSQNELIATRHYTAIHNLKRKIAYILDRPELATAELSEVIAWLEDIENEDLRKSLQAEELIFLLKDLKELDKAC